LAIVSSLECIDENGVSVSGAGHECSLRLGKEFWLKKVASSLNYWLILWNGRSAKPLPNPGRCIPEVLLTHLVTIEWRYSFPLKHYHHQVFLIHFRSAAQESLK
jgi:hypothetical protein